jgi:hypothetical protein
MTNNYKWRYAIEGLPSGRCQPWGQPYSMYRLLCFQSIVIMRWRTYEDLL